MRSVVIVEIDPDSKLLLQRFHLLKIMPIVEVRLIRSVRSLDLAVQGRLTRFDQMMFHSVFFAKHLEEMSLGLLFESLFMRRKFVGEDDMVIGLNQLHLEGEEVKHVLEKVFEIRNAMALQDLREPDPCAVINGGVLIGPSPSATLDFVGDIFDINLDSIARIRCLITKPVFFLRSFFWFYNFPLAFEDFIHGGARHLETMLLPEE